ncbi:MAG: glycosyltransferase, partial [Thermoleophilia bacterium]|nr:glycosyltransferase [Thermoleophilia bacterium]
LELPYYFAWSFQSRDREHQEQLRAYFLGERRHTQRERVAVLCAQARREDLRPPGHAQPTASTSSPGAAAAHTPAGVPHHDIDVMLLTCSTGCEPAPAGAVDFRALAWRPSPNGDGPRWVVPPLVEVVDFLEEQGCTALHTDSTAGQGLLALAAARLLHLPLTGAVDPDGLESRPGRRSLAARLRRRYLTWFYGRLDEAYVPTRAAARALIAGGVDPGRIALLPAPAQRLASGDTRERAGRS